MWFRATPEHALLVVFWCRPWTPSLKPVGLVSSNSQLSEGRQPRCSQHQYHQPSRINILINKGKVTHRSDNEIQSCPQDTKLNLACAGSDQKASTIWQLSLTAREISCVNLAGWWAIQMGRGAAPQHCQTWLDPDVSPQPAPSEASWHDWVEGSPWCCPCSPCTPVTDLSLAEFRCWRVRVWSSGGKYGIKQQQKRSPWERWGRRRSDKE